MSQIKNWVNIQNQPKLSNPDKKIQIYSQLLKYKVKKFQTRTLRKPENPNTKKHIKTNL